MRAVPYTTVGMDGSVLPGAMYTDTDGQQYTYVTGGATTPTGTSTSNGSLICRAIAL